MKKILLILMAVFAFGIQNVSAQDAPLKIVTNHPDFKIKVKRCAASGKTIVIDLILSNVGATDVENIEGFGGIYYGSPRGTEAYDDEGNIYQERNIYIKVANRDGGGEFKIPVGVPMRYAVFIENVPTSVQSIARLSLEFRCEKWGLNGSKLVKLANIPISRD